MNKTLATILLIVVGLLVYTLATMPDPYRYGGCPDGWKVVKVETSCKEIK